MATYSGRPGWNPFLRVFLFLHVLILAMSGAPSAVAIVAAVATITVLLQPASPEKAVALRATLFYFVLSLLFAVPTRDPDPSSLLGPTRLYTTMVTSVVFFLSSSPSDFIHMARVCRLPSSVSFVVAALARYVPIAFEAMADVLLAQRSRGLRLNIAAVFRITTYSALVVPLIASIARNANALWISMHLRPLATLIPIVPRWRIRHVGILLASALLWSLP